MLLPGKRLVVSLTLTIIALALTLSVHAETVEYDGLIEPSEIVEIGSPAEGIVAVMTVDRNSPITKEQVLVELESSVEKAVLKKSTIIAAFDSEINLQKTQLAFAKRAHKRIRKLSAISAQDKDQAETSVGLSRFRLAKARETKTMAELELEKARAVLARRSIKSPLTGVVVERYVSPGEYVNNQPLLRVARIDPLRVEVIVPARMYGRITPGMKATIVPELKLFGEKTATVTIADKIIDSASNTFGVRLTLPNTDQQLPGGVKCLVRFNIGDNKGGKENKPAMTYKQNIQLKKIEHKR